MIPQHKVVPEEASLIAPAGPFRVYLGAAAGVGKTVAMLNEGRRRRQRGTDVVIGFVESHGRPLTEAEIRDLEVVPRKVVTYRGARFEEMDLDAVLARRPQARSSTSSRTPTSPGSGRHEKRWQQDVLELLDSGIALVTTVNIQRLESLADAAEKMTGAVVRERVPDWVVREADQIELVDSSPEQLRRRMLHETSTPREGPRGAHTLFPAREPDRPARARSAVRRGRDQRIDARLPPQDRSGRGLGDDRADHGRGHGSGGLRGGDAARGGRRA